MIKTKREATALFSWAIALLRSPSDSNEIYTRAPGSISGTEDSLVNEHTSVLATSGTFCLCAQCIYDSTENEYDLEEKYTTNMDDAITNDAYVSTYP